MSDGIVFVEGLTLQGDMLFNPWGVTNHDTLGVGVLPDSITLSDTTTYGDVSAYLSGRGPLDLDAPFFQLIQVGDSDATATLAPVEFSLVPGVDSITLASWVLYSGSDSVLLWGGDVSPPLTLSTTTFTAGELEEITIRYGACSAQPAASILAMDDLGEQVSGILNGQVPRQGNAWELLSGSWEYNGGYSATATGSLPAAFNSIVIECDEADVQVIADVIVGGNSVGVTVRATDATHFLAVEVDHANSRLAISSVNGSTVTLIDSVSLTLPSGTLYRLVVQTSGSTVLIGLDGVLYLTETITYQQTATKHGLVAFANVSEYVRFFLVVPI